MENLGDTFKTSYKKTVAALTTNVSKTNKALQIIDKSTDRFHKGWRMFHNNKGANSTHFNYQPRQDEILQDGKYCDVWEICEVTEKYISRKKAVTQISSKLVISLFPIFEVANVLNISLRNFISYNIARIIYQCLNFSLFLPSFS